MARTLFLLALLAASTPVFAQDADDDDNEDVSPDNDEDDDNDECGDHVDELLTEGPLKEKYKSIHAMLVAHDVNKDVHVDEGDLESLFKEAGVKDECLAYAKEAMNNVLE